jgi:hypothetical protein
MGLEKKESAEVGEKRDDGVALEYSAADRCMDAGK